MSPALCREREFDTTRYEFYYHASLPESRFLPASSAPRMEAAGRRISGDRRLHGVSLHHFGFGGASFTMTDDTIFFDRRWSAGFHHAVSKEALDAFLSRYFIFAASRPSLDKSHAFTNTSTPFRRRQNGANSQDIFATLHRPQPDDRTCPSRRARHHHDATLFSPTAFHRFGHQRDSLLILRLIFFERGSADAISRRWRMQRVIRTSAMPSPNFLSLV